MKVPDGNVEALESNFFINNILDIMENNRRKKNLSERSIVCIACDLRGDSTVATMCQICEMPLCLQCLQNHKHEDHTLPQTESNIPVCIEHAEEEKFYCQDCKELFCKECIAKYHRKHDYVELKKALKTHRRVIDWLLVRCKVKMLSLTEEVKRAQVMDDMVAKSAHDTKLSIDEHFRKLAEALEKKRMELKAGVDSLKNEKMKQILFQQENLSMTTSSLASVIDFTEQAMKEGNEKELLSMKNKICDRLQELSEMNVEKCPEVWWSFYLHSPFDPNVSGNDVGFMSKFRVQSDSVRATVSLTGGEEGVLYNTFVNQLHCFVITLEDKDGIQVRIGGQDVRVSIRVPSSRDDDLSISSFEREYDEAASQCGQYEDVKVQDNKDGTHSFKYKPKRQGDYYLCVTVNTKPLVGDLMWRVQGPLGFGDKANELGCALLQPPYGMSPSWHHSVAGGKYSWKIKRVSHNEYEIVRVGVMMDFTSDKWGWCNGKREEPDPSLFSLPEHHPSNIPTWEEGEVFVFYSNEESGKFIIYNEMTKQSDVFQRCPGTVARPYVFPASYFSFSMDKKFEKKLTKMQENEKK